MGMITSPHVICCAQRGTLFTMQQKETKTNSLFDNFVDLSLPITAEMPVSWPTHHNFEQSHWRSFAKGDNYQTNYIVMDEHCGTHCDAPAHFIREEDYKGSYYWGDVLPLDLMQGPLIKIDVKSLKSINKDGISPKIEVDFIKAWENENQQIIKGDIVVFNSGWDKYLKESSLYHKYAVGPIIAKDEPGWPVPSIETLDYLFAKGVICYAIDTPSMGASDGGEILHRHALAKSLIFVEGLANLDSVPIVGYHFMFLPLKLDKATGCPGRAIALGVGDL